MYTKSMNINHGNILMNNVLTDVHRTFRNKNEMKEAEINNPK